LRNYARGFSGEARTRLEVEYLRSRRKQVTACGRSVLRDLRMDVSIESLKREGLLKREAFYLSLPPLPLPVDKKRLGVLSIPEGWRRESLPKGRAARARAREAERCFFGILTSNSWQNIDLEKDRARQVWKESAGGYAGSWSWFKSAYRSHARKGIRSSTTYKKLACRVRLRMAAVWRFSRPAPERRVWMGGRRTVGIVEFRSTAAAMP